jgi:hypothetical protein
MSKIYKLPITPNAGYSADQVKSVSVSELIELLQTLDQDAQIVTNNISNTYGACYGQFELSAFDEVNN